MYRNGSERKRLTESITPKNNATLSTVISEGIMRFPLKQYLVDTSSRILFYVPVIGVWEKFGAGMENEEVLKSRMLAVLINTVGLGRAHTLCRNALARITNTDEQSSQRRKAAVDFAAGFAVGLSSYSAVLYFADVSFTEGIRAAPFTVAFTCFSGSYYGRFNDWYRQKFNLSPILTKKSNQPYC